MHKNYKGLKKFPCKLKSLEQFTLKADKLMNKLDWEFLFSLPCDTRNKEALDETERQQIKS